MAKHLNRASKDKLTDAEKKKIESQNSQDPKDVAKVKEIKYE